MRGLEGLDIICMSPNYWNSTCQVAQQIMKFLAHQNRVLFVEPPVASFPFKYPERWKKWVDWLGEVKKIERNLFRVTAPPVLPFKGRSLKINNFSQRIVERWVKKQARQLHFENSILWIFLPNYFELVGKLGESFTIYHILDEFTAVPWYRQNVISKMEERLLSQADLVITCSPQVYENKKYKCRNIINISNGVDFELFVKAANDISAIPPEFGDIPKPIIGFIGVLDFRIDFLLLKQLAKELPDYSFVFVGPARVDISSLKKLKNFHFLGFKSHLLIPQYVNAFNVCLIPYQLNNFVLGISPLKLFEYFSLGKPVVAPDIPAIRVADGLTYLSHNQKEFIQNVKVAVKEDDPLLRKKRIELAAENSWKKKIEIISSKLAEILYRKKNK